MHHLVATGTCSSTGYSANYGPVPHCPSGTGWWFAFLFAGIIGTLVGAMMAGSIGLIFAGMFGAIGVGALTIAFDSQARSSTQVFGAVFGGVFALVGITAAVFVLVGAIQSLRPRQVQYGRTKTSSHGTGQGAPPSTGSLGLPTPTPTAATVPPTFVASST